MREMAGEADKGTNVEKKLDRAKKFLRNSVSEIDPELPRLLEVLNEAGASECWHKHGTFFEHLFHVYRILKLWDVPDAVARCGLFHSSYSNSYVNLAIFEANVDRQRVRELIGEAAEELVYWFCVVPRQELIFNKLLFAFSDEDLLSALHSRGGGSEIGGLKETHGLQKHASDDVGDHGSRLSVGKGKSQLRPLIPPEGITVKHIRTGDDLQVPPRLIAIFLMLTMADFIDQLYGWQDELFNNDDGKLEFEGDSWTALWPGDGKPGLWMSAISRMGVLLNIIIHDLEECKEEEIRNSGLQCATARSFEEIALKVPPVFNNCTAILSPSNLIKSRDLYWEAMFITDRNNILELAEPLLVDAIRQNPWAAELHLVRAQILLSKKEYALAQKEAEEGLELLLDWGTQWDKRMTWDGWVAWARVLELHSKERTWPRSAWGIINLGLVK